MGDRGGFRSAGGTRSVVSQILERWRRNARHGSAVAERPIHLGFCTAAVLIVVLSSCVAPDKTHRIVISAKDQKLALLEKDRLMAIYPVSTSKYGLGDGQGTWRTPLGQMEVAQKIGGGAAAGTVFKDRRRTGEIVGVNAPGRDPIVSRILWLRGREPQNANAFARDIYIHGTPEERNIGKPASYGCIRMRSADVIQLYDIVGPGAQVTIVDQPLRAVVPGLNVSHMSKPNPDGGMNLPLEP
jgi:lipoprotein-anchoring transpeptidase ErfK/SrfK